MIDLTKLPYFSTRTKQVSSTMKSRHWQRISNSRQFVLVIARALRSL